MVNTYYRLNPRIVVLDDSANAPDSSRSLAVMDPYNNSIHLGGRAEASLAKYLVSPRRYIEIVSFSRSDEFLSRVPERAIRRVLELYRDRGLVDKSESGFQDMQAAAVAVTAPRIRTGKHDVFVRGFCRVITFAPTTRCNLMCKHCDVDYGGLAPRRKELSMREIVDLFDQLEASALWELRISGGEPLARRDGMDIVVEAAKRRFKVMLYTNCFAVDEETVARIEKVQAERHKGFTVHYSIDGASRASHDWLRGTKGAFEQLLGALEMLRSAGVRLIAECTVYPGNVDEIAQICDLCARFGTLEVALHPVFVVGRARQGLRKLLLSPEQLERANDVALECSQRYDGDMDVGFDFAVLPPTPFLSCVARKRWAQEQSVQLGGPAREQRERRCSAGTTQMSIDADGTVYPCPNSHGIPEFAMGNVRTERAEEIWCKDCWLFFRGAWGYEDLPICRSCEFIDQCGYAKDCRPRSMAMWGDPYGPSASCSVYRGLFGLNVPPMGQYTVSLMEEKG